MASGGLKKGIKAILDHSWIPFIQYTMKNISSERRPTAPTLVEMASQRARALSLDYVDANMQRAMFFSAREPLWDFAVRNIGSNGLAAEFGVWQAYSIKRFARHFQVVYGFDSFCGLREDWVGHDLLKGNFDLKGLLPSVPANVRLIPGWFEETIPQFLQEHRENFSFVHVDCDTYETASQLLSLIGERLQSGTVVVFDEYLGFHGWQHGEYRAWQDFVTMKNLKYQYIACAERQVAVRLL
jgi:Macrocin-O-methyltransferase (TylF)